MPFTAVLKHLCSITPGALGAVFVDDEGENVQRVVWDPCVTDYDLDVAGAHIPPLVSGWHPWNVLRLSGGQGHALAAMVQDRYVVVLLTRHFTPLPLAARNLRQATHKLRALM